MTSSGVMAALLLFLVMVVGGLILHRRPQGFFGAEEGPSGGPVTREGHLRRRKRSDRRGWSPTSGSRPGRRTSRHAPDLHRGPALRHERERVHGPAVAPDLEVEM